MKLIYVNGGLEGQDGVAADNFKIKLSEGRFALQAGHFKKPAVEVCKKYGKLQKNMREDVV